MGYTFEYVRHQRCDKYVNLSHMRKMQACLSPQPTKYLNGGRQDKGEGEWKPQAHSATIVSAPKITLC